MNISGAANSLLENRGSCVLLASEHLPGFSGHIWLFRLCLVLLVIPGFSVMLGSFGYTRLFGHTRLDRVSGFVCNVSLVDATRERFLRFIP